MKSSKFYQRCLQITRISSDILLFLTGWFLGKEKFTIATSILVVKIVFGYLNSELVYRRLKATVREGQK